MRVLERNKRAFWYAPYLHKESIVDEYGNDTGEYRLIYGDPIQMRANISAATGYAQAEQFGNQLSYDRVIVTDDMECGIDENSVLCIDVLPAYDGGDLLYDYIVRKIARSLNSISIAISKVDIS